MELRTNGSEIINYDYEGFLSCIGSGALSSYANFSSDSHWHDDIEFLIVTSGEMLISINGAAVAVKQDEGIMINARQLHRVYSKDSSDCEYICFLLHPIMLCTTQYMESAFVSPFISAADVPFVALSPETGWQNRILEILKELYPLKNAEFAPLYIQSAFCRIWAYLLANVPISKRNAGQYDSNLSVLKTMLLYIQSNYAEKLSLAEIAYSGSVSKSTCLLLFKKYINDTPVNYLISYRLKQAASMLAKTTQSISQISASTGFSSESYFAECFRRKYGTTPGKYRKTAPQ